MLGMWFKSRGILAIAVLMRLSVLTLLAWSWCSLVITVHVVTLVFRALDLCDFFEDAIAGGTCHVLLAWVNFLG
jgi:hypothetical protein